MTTNQYELTSKEKAVLYMLHSGIHSDNIDSLLLFTETTKNKLLNLNLIVEISDSVYIPDFSNDVMLNPDKTKFVLTNLAASALTNNAVILQYPLEQNSTITSYDKTIQTMSDSAVEALCCSQINNSFYNRLSVNQKRVLLQHLLDNSIELSMGQELINKWYVRLAKSIEYYKKKQKLN